MYILIFLSSRHKRAYPAFSVFLLVNAYTCVPTQAAVEIISAAVPAHRFHDEQDSAGGLIIGIAHGKVGGFEYIITFFKTRSLQNNIKPFRSAGILKLPLHAVVVAVHDGFV